MYLLTLTFAYMVFWSYPERLTQDWVHPEPSRGPPRALTGPTHTTQAIWHSWLLQPQSNQTARSLHTPYTHTANPLKRSDSVCISICHLNISWKKWHVCSVIIHRCFTQTSPQPRRTVYCQNLAVHGVWASAVSGGRTRSTVRERMEEICFGRIVRSGFTPTTNPWGTP